MKKDTSKKYTHKNSAQIKSAAPMKKNTSKKRVPKDSAPIKIRWTNHLRPALANRSQHRFDLAGMRSDLSRSVDAFDGIETAHMIRKGQLSDEDIPAYKQFMALAG
jgi:hypothetical protein